MIVATVRALKMHGGVARDQLGKEDLTALRRGMANLARHVENVRRFGVPAVVALNRFTSDTEAEHGLVRELCRELGRRGGGLLALGRGRRRRRSSWPSTWRICARPSATSTAAASGRSIRTTCRLWDKLKTIATQIYGADDIIADKRVRAQFADLQEQGFGHYPVCVAKTQYSFSTDPNLKGAPSHHVVPIREVRLANGAEFVVVICGDIMTMPGLPRVPAANQIRIDQGGLVEGLFCQRSGADLAARSGCRAYAGRRSVRQGMLAMDRVEGERGTHIGGILVLTFAWLMPVAATAAEPRRPARRPLRQSRAPSR